jgi:hypothetical protein
MKEIALTTAIAVLLFASACRTSTEAEPEVHAEASAPAPAKQPSPSPSSDIPNLQTEILDDRFKDSKSPLASFDFRNFTYPLPRGWQNPDGTDLTLVDGKRLPISRFVTDDMEDDEKAEARAMRRIGMSYVTTRYLDLTGDGQDEAIVILKVETTGNAIPQLVYVYEWKNDKPELVWNFRTGDRADGGLKDLRIEDGEIVLELYGQDRFLLGETETSKITGDEEQLCCPTFFTRTIYKWNGKTFQLQKKRLTYSMTDKSQAPQENMIEAIEAKNRGKK